MYQLRHASRALKFRIPTGFYDLPRLSLRGSRVLSSVHLVPTTSLPHTRLTLTTDTSTRTKDKKSSLKKLLDRRRKALQSQRKHQKKKARQHISLDLTFHRGSDFETLFDIVAPTHSITKLREIMTKISKRPSQATTIPLSTTLLSLLHTTPPCDTALITTLEFLLSREPSVPLLSHQQPKHETLQVILRARQRAVNESLPWDDGRAKPARRGSGSASEAEAQQLAHVLQANLPTKQHNSLIDLLEAYAATSGSIDSEDATVKKSKAPYNMRNLSTHLKKRAGTHYHLVAPAVGEFFGYESDIIGRDPKFIQSQKKWELYRQQFTNFLLSIQKHLFDDFNPHEPELAGTSSEIVAAVDLEPVRSSGTVLVDRRFRRPVHAVFEAVQLHEATTVAADSHSMSTRVPTQRMVFLDNLPIDITTNELMELYSRCGDIECIEIFNQRPDLDPGPLTKTQLVARRRSHVLVNSRLHKWQRPRSPVYARVTYRDDEGYRVCIDDSLRIFGMLIQKHPVRSIRALDMKQLFLEDIEGIPCMDLECQLREQLSPDLLVCLDANQNNRATIGSCEIRFPSFENAFESFGKLKNVWNVVNWMRTPKDASLWWTRKRGFD